MCPVKHWSYVAVQKLVADGIIDGTDVKYNGDKLLTRYEMAVIVARALGKEEKPNAEQKALIEKLATEYSSELQSIGVSLSTVEEKTERVRFMGFLGFRYDHQKDKGVQTEAAHLDMNTILKVDDKTTVTLQNLFQSNFRSTGAIASSLDAAIQAKDPGGYYQLAYSMYVNTVVDKVNVTAGQFPMIPGYGMVLSTEDMQGSRVKGLKASFDIGALKTTLFTGKTLGAYVESLQNSYVLPSNAYAGNYNLAEADYAVSKDTNIKAAYHNYKNDTTDQSINYYELGFDTKLSRDLAFEAATGKSNQDVANNKSYYAQLKYKQAMFWAVPHSYDVFVGYRSMPANATINGGSSSDFYGNYTYNIKGVTFGAHYVPSRMTMLTVWYTAGKTIDNDVLGSAAGTKQDVFRSQFDFFF